MLIKPFLQWEGSFDTLFSIPEPIQGLICAATQPIELTQEKLNTLQTHLELPEALKNAVLKRQVEFLTGRACAQSALQQLGVDFNETLGVGASREPLWPEGIIGSITHNAHWALALAAQCHTLCLLGIDLETIVDPQTEANIEALVCTPQEQQQLIQAGLNHQQATTLLFSAKESLFKALYPSVQRYFDFSCARLSTFSIAHRHMTLTLTQTLSDDCPEAREINCYYALDKTQVITLCVE